MSLRMITWVLFAGLPGTGKSTLARALAEPLQAAILDKDRVREALFPGPLTDYTREQDQLCMDAMVAAAAYLTEKARAPFIFFDGRTFSQRQQREEVVRAAVQAGARWRILHVQCSEAAALMRLSRADPAHPAKNRSPVLYHALQERFEALAPPYLAVDTTDGLAGQLDAIVAYLRSTGGLR